MRSGFFVRSRSAFKKSSVNDVIIDQTPLMRLFKRYAMKVSVGGYGGSKSETAVIVPSGRRGDKAPVPSIFPVFGTRRQADARAAGYCNQKPIFISAGAVFYNYVSNFHSADLYFPEIRQTDLVFNYGSLCGYNVLRIFEHL